MEWCCAALAGFSLWTVLGSVGAMDLPTAWCPPTARARNILLVFLILGGPLTLAGAGLSRLAARRARTR